MGHPVFSCSNFLLLKNDLHALKHEIINNFTPIMTPNPIASSGSVYMCVCQCVPVCEWPCDIFIFQNSSSGGPESGPNRENAIDKKLPMVTNSKLKNVQILSCKTQTSRLVDEDVSSNSVMVSE